MKKHHYVYKITNLNPVDEQKYYIGVRSTYLLPENDTNYWSSSTHLKKAIMENGIISFKKEILSEWNTREEAMNEEIRLHTKYNVSSNPKFYNKANSKSTGFSPEGRVVVRNKQNGNYESITVEEYIKEKELYENNFTNNVTAIDLTTYKICSVSKELFYSEDKYIGVNLGKVAVFDKQKKVNTQVSVEEYVDNSNYIVHTEGTILVIDTKEHEAKRIKREEFDNDCEHRYISYFEGYVLSKNIHSNEIKFVSYEEFEMNANLVGINKNRITVKNKETGCYEHITVDEFEKNKRTYTFILSGKIAAFDEHGNKIWVNKDEFHKSKNLVGRNAGKIPVLNKKTGKRQLVDKSEFYSTDDYEALSSNGIMVRNTNTGICKRISKEELEKNPHLYEGINKGLSNAFDISTKTMRRVSKEEFKNDENLINNNSNYYKFFDNNGVQQYVKYGSITKWCKEEKMPTNAFQISAKNNGSPLFVNTSTQYERLIKLKGWDQYRNWYVIKGKVSELVDNNVK